jgi:hypothetical protein
MRRREILARAIIGYCIFSVVVLTAFAACIVYAKVVL